MSDESGLCFVDTNVIVYAFEKHDSPKRRVAQGLLTQLMDDDRLRVSTQVLQEVFVTLTRKVAVPCSAAEALAVVDDLVAWPLVVVDYTVIRAAARLADEAQLSFWNSLIVVAAAQAGASVLYSEDLNDGEQVLGVRIRNPFGNEGERKTARELNES